jgi:NADP-dependent 3-hydroxy acid dehydrogenase YdfG
VLAVGRNAGSLQELEQTRNIAPLALDIRDTASLARRLADETVDILVNNAGIMPPLVPFDEMSAEAIDAAISVNLTASIHLTSLVIPKMCARGRGHVFFTGSTAGHATFPKLAVYGATKAAISAFADGLRADVSPRGVKVTEIVAGRTQTNLYATLLSEEMRDAMYAGGGAVQPRDIAEMVLAVLALPQAANVSRFDIVPTRQMTATGATRKDD